MINIQVVDLLVEDVIDIFLYLNKNKFKVSFIAWLNDIMLTQKERLWWKYSLVSENIKLRLYWYVCQKQLHFIENIKRAWELCFYYFQALCK